MRMHIQRSRSTWLWVLVVATLATTFAMRASAHAYLDRALPVAGSVVRESPREVKLWFTQRVESAFSRIEVFDAAGKRVDAGDVTIDPGDAKLLRVSLPALAPGTYRVKWRVVSVDTHASEGGFTFDVVR